MDRVHEGCEAKTRPRWNRGDSGDRGCLNSGMYLFRAPYFDAPHPQRIPAVQPELDGIAQHEHTKDILEQAASALTILSVLTMPAIV